MKRLPSLNERKRRSCGRVDVVRKYLLPAPVFAMPLWNRKIEDWIRS